MAKSKQRRLASIRELAKALGVSHATVHEHTRDPRWPFARKSPWSTSDLAAMRKWRAHTLAANPADATTAGDDIDVSKITRATSAAKLRVLIERAANLKVDRLIKEREYVPREQVETMNSRRWAAWREAHTRLPRALRQQFADSNDPAECERILADALRHIFNAFASASGAPDHDGSHAQKPEPR